MRRLVAAAGFTLWAQPGLFAQPAAVADPAQLDFGRRVALVYCSACHATGATDTSPHRIVIPFRELYRRRPIEMLEKARETGVVLGHDEMPLFELGPDKTAALLAYIESLWPASERPAEAPPRKP
jgi:mono/diheme cytochrome c family protein